MRQLRFGLWAVGNILLTVFVVTIGWLTAYPIAAVLHDAVVLSVLLFLILPVFTVFWPEALVLDAIVSIELVRLASRKKGRLAHLKFHSRYIEIQLTTTDPRVTRWNDLGIHELIPGWGAVAAAYLLTAGGCLAIGGQMVFGWPLWASALCLIPWAAGWLWYALLVRARVWVPPRSADDSLLT